MLRQTSLLCAIVSLTGAQLSHHQSPPHKPGEIVGGFQLKPSGKIARELTPSEVEDLRRRDNTKKR